MIFHFYDISPVSIVNAAGQPVPGATIPTTDTNSVAVFHTSDDARIALTRRKH